MPMPTSNLPIDQVPINIAQQRARNRVSPGLTTHNCRGPSTKNTKASIKVASLNMRGFKSANNNIDPNKWPGINKLLRDKKIAILALQESHLTAEKVDSLHSIYPKQFKIFFSPSRNASQAQGVAFALNKQLTNTEQASCREVIPGRAILLAIPWHNAQVLHVLNIYAPNAVSENSDFWKQIGEIWTQRRYPRPDLMVGDFNLVENMIDRIPAAATANDQASLMNLNALKAQLQLHDGWRRTYPSQREFTHTHSSGMELTYARLDRIYTSEQIVRTAVDWEIQHTAIDTDHRLVSVRIIHPQLPFIGKGRWTMPLFALDNPKLMQKITDLGMELQKKLEQNTDRTSMDNPQLWFKTFKDQILLEAREFVKKASPQLDRTITNLKADLAKTLAQPALDDLPEHRDSVSALSDRIRELEAKKYKSQRIKSAARHALKGDSVNKYWSKVNKENTPRDVIYSLELPDSVPTKYDNRSNKMAEIARNHHDLLQTNDIMEDPQREAEIANVLKSISLTLPDESKEELAARISAKEVQEALDKCENGSATGLNGLPYELWKALSKKFDEGKKKNIAGFDIISTLTAVYNDIETHGVDGQSQFTAGWMCPIYKKKDRRKIENYRPITLLNSDYKIFTKALANRLGGVIHNVVHSDQAGFIKGRNIQDQVKLTEMMIHYAEAMELDGAIIALDQEKAYDKIAHDYLWRVLEKMNFPPELIKTIQHLYANAETEVFINGERSMPFRVTRGVRQGDPMSCALFDLAIEPLACMIRQSSLTGFTIPGLIERVLTSLFADDTTVFLARQDLFADLITILSKWCRASRARFNSEKTEVIPIGSETYRHSVLRDHQINPGVAESAIPPEIHIVPDGEAIRSLGAWIGNKTDQATPWGPILDKINLALERWGRGHPSLRGRKHVIQMMVGGMTQYLTAVQGMPKHVERALTKIITDFVWDHRPMHPIKRDILYLPRQQGGLGILDLEARNEAIHLMWLKSYLNLTESRPRWAFVADVLVGECITRDSGNVDKWSKINQYLQTWRAGLHPQSKLPPSLLRMFKTAKNYHVKFEAVNLSTSLKKKMPAWFHIGAKPLLRTIGNDPFGTCLRRTHGIKSVGDLLKTTKRFALTAPEVPHLQEKCVCKYCKRDRSKFDCYHPEFCADAAKRMLQQLHTRWDPAEKGPKDGLSLTRHRRKMNITNAELKKEIIFDPSLTTKGSLTNGFRVFTDPADEAHPPAHRPQARPYDTGREEKTYTDGSSLNNGDLDARCGSGVYFSPNDPRNASIRVPGTSQSNQVGEVVGVITAVQVVSPAAKLRIISDSLYTIQGLTKHLPKWEDRGWIGVANKAFFQKAAYLLRIRTAPTIFEWIKGHSGDVGNDQADRLAAEGAQAATESNLDLTVPPAFRITGARLATLTQALAYRGIRESKTPPERMATTVNLDIARYAVQAMTKKLPTDATLWLATQSTDFRRPIADLLWKAMHDGLKCGRFWKGDYAHRAECQHCDCIENEEHIFLECTHTGQRQIWELTKNLWLKGSQIWPPLSLGILLGCGLITFSTPSDKILPGRSRLYRILISEALFLIWKLRCECRIGHGDNSEYIHSPAEVRNRWAKTITDRFELDRAMVNPRLHDHALSYDKFHCTWKPIVENHNLPIRRWFLKREVLVGRELPGL